MSPIKPKRPRVTGGNPGRPVSEEGDTTLHIRLTEEDRVDWEKEAGRVGLKLSTFVKMAISKHIADEKARRRAVAAAASE